MASVENGASEVLDKNNTTENIEDTDGNVQIKLEKQESNNKDENGGAVKRDASIKSKSVVKQGHLRIKEDGQKVYKKTPSQIIMSASQLGIGYSVGRLSAKPERDVLMVDFSFVEKVFFPSTGSKETPSHRYSDFRFKSYAPVAFRYFRDIFKIQPSDFLEKAFQDVKVQISLANEPIREIGNPGASGSLFFVSNDDMYIVKTVQHKEATFLQQLLPGYYMNLHQNPRTLLPKFFGLYCYQSGTSNIRLTVMNNLLPSKYKCHAKFDLKGSTYKRKANKAERSKKSPTYKDLDYLNMYPDGIMLDADTYDAVIKTISRDLRVLESFSIMDYSFLLGIHNLDQAAREKQENLVSPSTDTAEEHNPEREARRNEFVAALEAIQIQPDEEDDYRPLRGIPAKNSEGERLILFMGIIDILQSYRLAKKMEHGWKSLLTDGDTVSVHKPSFYAKRFLDFIKDKVFTRLAVQRGPSKRRSVKINPAHLVNQVKDIPLTGESSTKDGDNTVEKQPKIKMVTILDPKETSNNEKENKTVVMAENNEGSSSAEKQEIATASTAIENNEPESDPTTTVTTTTTTTELSVAQTIPKSESETSFVVVSPPDAIDVNVSEVTASERHVEATAQTLNSTSTPPSTPPATTETDKPFVNESIELETITTTIISSDESSPSEVVDTNQEAFPVLNTVEEKAVDEKEWRIEITTHEVVNGDPESPTVHDSHL